MTTGTAESELKFTLKGTGIGRLLLSGLLWLICLAYFATSAVVIVNAFVWLPSFPSAWYWIQGILYFPFQPYFGLTSHLLGGSSVPYSVYAGVVWLPFFVSATAGMVLLLRRSLACRC